VHKIQYDNKPIISVAITVIPMIRLELLGSARMSTGSVDC